MSLTTTEFAELTTAIERSSGVDAVTAGRYAAAVAGAPEISEDGEHWIIRDVDDSIFGQGKSWDDTAAIIATIRIPDGYRQSEEKITPLSVTEPPVLTDIVFQPHCCEVKEKGVPGILHESMIRDETRGIVARELAARWFCWAHDLLPESVGENPQALSPEDAAIALANHLERMDAN